MDHSLTAIQTQVQALAIKINAPMHLMPAFGTPDDCQPNIVMDAGNRLWYQVSERGRLISNEAAANADEVLYFVFRDIVFSMAVRYELKNRNKSNDCRRIIFAKQLELLGLLSEEWKKRRQEEQQTILQSHPFDDNSQLRLDYLDQLRTTGKGYEEAMLMANSRFPAPTAIQAVRE